MTDDFIFGDDSDEDDADERTLFGSADASRESTETDRRFGTATTDDTDSRPAAERVRAAVGTSKTTTITALALALVVAFGLVAYPFVMGAFDTTDTDETDVPAGGAVGGTPDMTVTSAGEVRTTVETPSATSVPTATPTATTTAAANQPTETTSATPTPTPTPVPTRGFPAGTPIKTNETTD